MWECGGRGEAVAVSVSKGLQDPWGWCLVLERAYTQHC